MSQPRKGLEEAVYWLHAHTKDAGWTVDAEVREVWNAEVTERTPLTGELLDGAVDVAWFARAYKLGSERWAMLDKAAKYASGGGGHKRAQLFADTLLGKVSFEDLSSRIKAERHQGSVRAVGLLPCSGRETEKNRGLGALRPHPGILRRAAQIRRATSSRRKTRGNHRAR